MTQSNYPPNISEEEIDAQFGDEEGFKITEENPLVKYFNKQVEIPEETDEE